MALYYDKGTAFAEILRENSAGTHTFKATHPLGTGRSSA
jgi:hypothetical protein